MTHAIDLAYLAGEHRRRLRESIPPDLVRDLVSGRILRRLDKAERDLALAGAAASSSGSDERTP